MPKSGPIVIAEDDLDDQHLLGEVMNSLGIQNPLRFFVKCELLYEYLLTTSEDPFIILSDVNLPGMSGIELKKKINENEFLRSKSIPFIFLTTGANPHSIQQAYHMMVQGYFQKENTFDGIQKMMQLIIDYWKICKHPNSL